ncbi:hypothetical protein HCN44_011129 [Aphidius gifuensis]|uniref:Venom protein n=1 Tax=Aphidius gifuensis TaxID=684658 RepID=A0A835CUZ4_APHGI|nr:icarapin-like [Aphidius gifuensis]KAF7993860.1 hypothetical protein HCN44_011129 [Aphidius gifuensis]
MKSIFGVFVVVCFIAVVHSFPGVPRDSNESDKKSNGETILILPGLHENPFHGDSFQPSFSFSDLTDDGDSDEDSLGYHPFRFNFDSSSFFKRMQDTMKNLEAQLANSFSHIPKPGSLLPWGNVPDGANSTSTKKVIDGHVVTINETTYKSDDDSTYVRFRIVDVQPDNTTDVTTESDTKDIDQNGGEVTDKIPNDNSSTPSPSSPSSPITTTTTTTESTKEETTPSSRSVETVEDLGNNEIPNQVDNFRA